MRLPPGFTLLQVVPALDAGGVEQTAVDVAEAVVAAGGRALVASRGGRLAERLQAAGGELVVLPVHSKNPLVMAANARALKRMILERGVDVVHARSRAPAFSALSAARATGRPFVATYAGVYNARSAFKRWYNGVMTRGDLVIANSAYTRAHILAEHRVDPDRVVAIPRGVDLARFDPFAVDPRQVADLRSAWSLDERPSFLLAARLTRWKGHGLILDALARLKAERGLAPVVVFAGDAQGREAYRAELAARVSAEGLSDQVRIVGHCADVPAALMAVDLALAPSLEPEAFGRAAVEAQAMGRPVIAADHGAARETVLEGETGWLAAPADAAAWAGAMGEAVAAGPNAWARMGEEGRVHARDRYSLEAMTRATLEVYARLLARKSTAAS